MKMMYEDELLYNGKKLFVHANFIINNVGDVEVDDVRAYDMYPQTDYDEIGVDEKLVDIVEEMIYEELYAS